MKAITKPGTIVINPFVTDQSPNREGEVTAYHRYFDREIQKDFYTVKFRDYSEEWSKGLVVKNLKN
jgi:hypothetical protein